MSLPDYSVWLTSERLEVEERLWAECKYYEWYAEAVDRVLRTGGTLLELGCGTGWMPTALKVPFKLYTGLDSNPLCLVKAREKHTNPDVTFFEGDIRTARLDYYDVTCAFAVLKHFGLHEVGIVIEKLVWYGDYTVFTIPPADTDFDDGVEFPHTHLSMATIERAVRAGGGKIRNTATLPNEELVVTAQRLL